MMKEVMAVYVELHESICEYNTGSVQKGDETPFRLDEIPTLLEELPAGHAILLWGRKG